MAIGGMGIFGRHVCPNRKDWMQTVPSFTHPKKWIAMWMNLTHAMISFLFFFFLLFLDTCGVTAHYFLFFFFTWTGSKVLGYMDVFFFYFLPLGYDSPGDAGTD